MSEPEGSIPKKRLKKWQVLLLFIVGLIVISLFLAPKSNSPTSSSAKKDNFQTNTSVDDKSAQAKSTEVIEDESSISESFVFCILVKDDTSEITKLVADIKKGLASKKDLIEPLQIRAESLQFSTTYLENRKVEDKDLTWLSDTGRSDLIKEMNSYYEWFAKTRVKLVDKGTVSFGELLLKNREIRDLFKPYCEKE